MKVKFMPSEEEHEIEFNETILNLAHRSGLHIQSVCKGIPSCAECRIQIVEGEHHVLPPSKKELDLIGTAHYVDQSRLSCQLRCFGDVIVDLSEQIEKEKRAQEKPRDRMARKDGEDSKAVLGGILDNVVAEDVDLGDEEKERKVEKVKVEAVKGDPNLDRRDAFYGSFYTGKKKSKSGGGKKKKKNRSGNRNNNNRKKTQSAKSSDGGESSDKPKKKRSRNRNRNKNRNRQQGPKAES